MVSTPRRIDLAIPYPVLLRSALNSGRGKLVNVSTDGAYIATTMSLLPQAHVRMQIILPDTRASIPAEAVVTWENRGRVRRGGLPPGYGLRFVKLPQETASKINQLLATPNDPTPTMPLGSRYDDFFQSQEEEHQGPPYALQRQSIIDHAPNAPGIFALSYDRAQEARVGRADRSLRAKLLEYVGQYAYFYFEVVEDPEELFQEECKMFHRMGGDRGQLDNVDHPLPPEGASLKCRVCVPAGGQGH